MYLTAARKECDFCNGNLAQNSLTLYGEGLSSELCSSQWAPCCFPNVCSHARCCWRMNMRALLNQSNMQFLRMNRLSSKNALDGGHVFVLMLPAYCSRAPSKAKQEGKEGSAPAAQSVVEPGHVSLDTFQVTPCDAQTEKKLFVRI